MAASATVTQEPSKPAHFSPPRWMSRAEKVAFRRVLDARDAIGKPVLATELDLVGDYISARSRILLLRRMAKAAVDHCRDPFDEYGQHPFGHEPNQRHAMALLRQCQAAEVACRRLARDLKLTDGP